MVSTESLKLLVDGLPQPPWSFGAVHLSDLKPFWKPFVVDDPRGFAEQVGDDE